MLKIHPAQRSSAVLQLLLRWPRPHLQDVQEPDRPGGTPDRKRSPGMALEPVLLLLLRLPPAARQEQLRVARKQSVLRQELQRCVCDAVGAAAQGQGDESQGRDDSSGRCYSRLLLMINANPHQDHLALIGLLLSLSLFTLIISFFFLYHIGRM